MFGYKTILVVVDLELTEATNFKLIYREKILDSIGKDKKRNQWEMMVLDDGWGSKADLIVPVWEKSAKVNVQKGLGRFPGSP